MKLLLILPLFLVMLPAYAQIIEPVIDPIDEEIAGIIQPDSPLWGLDVAIDQLMMILADPTTGERQILGLEIANERLHELKISIQENRLNDANEVRIEHEGVLVEIEKSLSQINVGDSNVEFKIKIELSERLDSHQDKIKEIEQEIEVEIKGTVTQEHLDFVNRVFDILGNKAEEVEIEIEDGIIEIEIELRNIEGLSSFDIRQLERDIRGETQAEIEIEVSNRGSGSFDSDNGDNGNGDNSDSSDSGSSGYGS